MLSSDISPHSDGSGEGSISSEYVGIGIAIPPHLKSDLIMDVHREFFSRIREIYPPTGFGRVIRMECFKNGHFVYLFLGCEQAHPSPVPEGMIRWSCSESQLTVFSPKASMKRPVSQDIKWIWKSAFSTRYIGDFIIPEKQVSCYLSAHAWYNRENACEGNDDVVLVHHDSTWAEKYTACVKEIQTIPGSDLLLRTVHYGSTAIPDIPAKPVIDILGEVSSLSEFKRSFLPYILDKPWEFWWYEDHITIIMRESFGGKRYCHLHVAPAGHHIWNGLVFHEYLLSHPDVARKYAALKEELSVRFRDDRERYTQEKGEFVREIVRLAKL